MNSLLKRSLSSVVFVILILTPLFFDVKLTYSWYALLGALCLNEIQKMTTTADFKPLKWTGLLIYFLSVAIVYEWLFPHGNQYLLLLATGVILLISAASTIFDQRKNPLESLASTLFSAGYVAMGFLGLSYFFIFRDDLPQPWIAILVFASIWINDAGAYLVGSAIGKTKLIERVSPGKTWEGSIGGLALAAIGGFLFSMMEGMPSATLTIGFALVCAIGGSLGDLFESRIKRNLGIKDSGVFLPGHGGFFDRFDAMLMAVPSSILYFELLLPK